MLYGWEGNRRFSTAALMCHIECGILSTYGLDGLSEGATNPAYTSVSSTLPFAFSLSDKAKVVLKVNGV